MEQHTRLNKVCNKHTSRNGGYIQYFKLFRTTLKLLKITEMTKLQRFAFWIQLLTTCAFKPLLWIFESVDTIEGIYKLVRNDEGPEHLIILDDQLKITYILKIFRYIPIFAHERNATRADLIRRQMIGEKVK